MQISLMPIYLCQSHNASLKKIIQLYYIFYLGSALVLPFFIDKKGIKVRIKLYVNISKFLNLINNMNIISKFIFISLYKKSISKITKNTLSKN